MFFDRLKNIDKNKIIIALVFLKTPKAFSGKSLFWKSFGFVWRQ